VDGLPRVASASIGALPIPSALAEWLIASAIDHSGLDGDWRLARQAFRRLLFASPSGMVVVSYVWDPGVLGRPRAMVFSPPQMVRIEAAQRSLVSLLESYPPRSHVPLATILAPLLARSAEHAPAQDRAALLVLAAYLSERSLSTLLPQASGWPRPRQVNLTLMGRSDSAQHFAISAALAAWAGEPAANAIGVYKEIDDSRGGSGFSFGDLAADPAGTRPGRARLATPAARPALRPRRRRPGAVVGRLAGVPFGSRVQASLRRYRQRCLWLMTGIEGRLDALPLYR